MRIPLDREETTPMSLVARLGPFARYVRRLHPEYWRFRRFLQSLPLDPDELPNPLPAPGVRDFLICGSSRTGTSLLAAMLHQPPVVATVTEPWDGMRMPPAELFASLRAELAGGRLQRGTVDYGELARAGRVVRIPEAKVDARIVVDTDHMLGVKWPVFWRYIDRLPETRFLVCVRDPIEVISSFKFQGGALADGLDYDTRFNRSMNATLRKATRDPEERRILLYDYVNTRLLPAFGKPNVFVVRYERWFADPDALLADIGRFLEVDLSNPRPKIRRESKKNRIDDRERARIARECRTAGPLGYDLGAA